MLSTAPDGWHGTAARVNGDAEDDMLPDWGGPPPLAPRQPFVVGELSGRNAERVALANAGNVALADALDRVAECS
jgi:hypothetical protein